MEIKDAIAHSKQLIVPCEATTPGFTVRNKYKFGYTVHVSKGDVLKCSIESKQGTAYILEHIGRDTTVDTVFTLDVNPGTLGLQGGFGAVFGLDADAVTGE